MKLTNQEVFFDGTFLSNSSGIGRDAKNFLKASLDIFGDSLQVIYPVPRLLSRTVKLETSPKYKIRQKASKLFSALLGIAFFCELPPQSVFIQPHIHGIVPKDPESIRHVIRLHDLFPITNPEWFKYLSRRLYKIGFQHSSKNGFFICDSQASREELIKIVPSAEARSSVSYCPVEKITGDSCLTCDGCHILKEQHLFVLAIGTLEPRKNYIELLSAWELSNVLAPKTEYLYIIGRKGWKSSALIKKMQRLKNQNVMWLSTACDGSIAALLQNSIYLVSASKAEGFNLPIAEALLAGKPVLISSNEVHREIYGNYANFFELNNVNELAIQLNNSLSEKEYFQANFLDFSRKYDFQNELIKLGKCIFNGSAFAE